MFYKYSDYSNILKSFLPLSSNYSVMKKYIIVLIFICVFFISCGIKRTVRNMRGYHVDDLEELFGKPAKIVPIEDGEIYYYQRAIDLNSTEIDQGRYAWDPIISPEVKKTEHIQFLVKDSIIIETKYEKEYDKN